jgi:CBS domain-containing protein
MNPLSERFLKTFKVLEDRMVSLSQLKGDYVSYARALEKVHWAAYDPLVARDDIFQFLKTAGELRNLLSHENDVAVPEETFVGRFEKIAQEILNPSKVIDIATTGERLFYCSPLTQVSSLVKRMEEKHLSHVPLLVNGQVKAVFSSKTFFYYYREHGTLNVEKDACVADFIDLNDAHALLEEYAFIARDADARSLKDRFAKKSEKEKRLAVLFVTQHGKKDEPLLGIITETDLLKIREV